MTDHPDIAIVTGAARGIGAAIARRLADSGWRVVRLDRAFADPQPMDVVADVADYADVAQAVAGIEVAHGPIGAVVNNAGITRDGFFHKLDPVADWDAVLRVNLTGPFHLCRAVLPGMRSRRFGRIVNMSSMNGLRGQPGQANYSAAKAGLIGMTRTLALEVAGLGITANCIAPGFVDTEMTRAIRPDIREAELAKVPAGRAGSVEEIAELVRYLCSDAAGFITGETVSINGGQLTA
ncbi:3-oxoacyl-ACP reductase FabG [Gemmobacter sp.]|uniref:3-oxoacyl-ACP reductase FabG n=1 Tax=Gemmobacter sp. TaxID=1898957 RepID=UPI002AFFCCE0|nr:3-oxoacyl-ACP reductase FabG [Gemmobacter sp.]